MKNGIISHVDLMEATACNVLFSILVRVGGETKKRNRRIHFTIDIPITVI